MKKIISLFLVICFSLIGFSGCFNKKINNEPVQIENSSKILLAYFSRADENYSVGYVEKGNTEWIADFISEKVNVDLTFKIERVTPYPSVYSECTDEAKAEKNANARPNINGSIENFDDYDIIFLGYPIWWSDLPMCVYTFIESYNWNGKMVIPFSTHEGSDWSGTLSTLENKLDGATIYFGYNCRGAQAKNNKSAVHTWLEGLGF